LGKGIQHRHAAHREGGMDAHGYGAMLEFVTIKPLSPAAVEELLKRLVTVIGERCLRAGARAIGHIKCYLETGQGYAKADIVRMKEGAFAETALGAPVTGGSLVINSILLGLHEDELERITMSSALSLLGEYGVSVVGKAVGHRQHS
jgi:hypothetical protein